MQMLIFFFPTRAPQIYQKSLKWLVSISAAISFFHLSTMKPLLWHMNNMPLIIVAHSKVLLALIRIKGHTPNPNDLIELNVPRFKHSNAAVDALKKAYNLVSEAALLWRKKCMIEGIVVNGIRWFKGSGRSVSISIM